MTKVLRPQWTFQRNTAGRFKGNGYLRMVADFRLNRDLATFFYSHDGRTWHQFGEPFHMVYDFRRLFMGTRAAIFNYATEQLGGRVDVDYYTIKVSEKPEE